MLIFKRQNIFSLLLFIAVIFAQGIQASKHLDNEDDGLTHEKLTARKAEFESVLGELYVAEDKLVNEMIDEGRRAFVRHYEALKEAIELDPELSDIKEDIIHAEETFRRQVYEMEQEEFRLEDLFWQNNRTFSSRYEMNLFQQQYLEPIDRQRRAIELFIERGMPPEVQYLRERYAFAYTARLDSLRRQIKTDFLSFKRECVRRARLEYPGIDTLENELEKIHVQLRTFEQGDHSVT